MKRSSPKFTHQHIPTSSPGNETPGKAQSLFETDMNNRRNQNPDELLGIGSYEREELMQWQVSSIHSSHDIEKGLKKHVTSLGAGVSKILKQGTIAPGMLPNDIVTSIALSLGTPSRPPRISPSSDRNSAAGVTASINEDMRQSFSCLCDLLFFGKDLPITMCMLEVVKNVGSAEGKDQVLHNLLAVFEDNRQHHRLIQAIFRTKLRKQKNCKELLEGENLWKFNVNVIAEICWLTY